MTNTHTETFIEEILRQKIEAKRKGEKFIDLVSREVHMAVGGYPGQNHRMPICCSAMYSVMSDGDQVLETPPSGKGAYLTIRYFL